MKKMNWKKIIRDIVFVAVFLLLFVVIQSCLQAKWLFTDDSNALTTGWQEYRNLEEDSVDVLFVGTSHVYHGIDPMYMYENSGITGFVIAGPGMRFDLTYLSLLEALKTQHPKVVFLDMSAIRFQKQQKETRCHKVFDQFPISTEKIRYAFTNGSKDMPPLEVLVPFFRYHSRWEDLNENDFDVPLGRNEKSSLRGHYITYKVTPTDLLFDTEKDFEVTDRTEEYFEKIVKLCENEGIELVPFKIPSPEWYSSDSLKSSTIAEKYGLTFRDLYYEMDQIGIDSQMDFFDQKAHLNQSGAEKLTKYMTEYLVSHYEFEDQRGSNEKWDEDLKAYNEYKAQKKIEQSQQPEEQMQEMEDENE